MFDFTPFGIIAIASIVATVISSKLKVPLTVLLILVGMIFGPGCLKLIKEDETIDTFAEIGSIFLLFLIGLEFNLEKLKPIILPASLVFIAEFIALFFPIYFFSLLVGFSSLQSFYLGVLFSVTSTALTVSILKDLKLEKRREVPLIVATSIIEDIVTLFLISFLSNLTSLSFQTIFIPLVKTFFILTTVIFIFPKLLSFFSSYIPGGEENFLMLSISVITFFLWLSSNIGISPSLGAFIAGSVISSLKKEEIERIVSKVSVLFVSVFFISYGMMVQPSYILSHLIFLLPLFLIIIMFKVLGVAVGFLFTGNNLYSSLFAGTSMSPIGEVSLLLTLLAVKNNILPSETLGLVSSIVILFFIFPPGIGCIWNLL